MLAVVEIMHTNISLSSNMHSLFLYIINNMQKIHLDYFHELMLA